MPVRHELESEWRPDPATRRHLIAATMPLREVSAPADASPRRPLHGERRLSVPDCRLTLARYTPPPSSNNPPASAPPRRRSHGGDLQPGTELTDTAMSC
jgi:hypothetical protein